MTRASIREYVEALLALYSAASKKGKGDVLGKFHKGYWPPSPGGRTPIP